MDQMTVVAGQEGKLLALLCRPAEIKCQVTIPHHVRFWGVDSGLRHSVGGSDYASVRT
jgi:L-arabinokinase